jgi:quinol monooxygenase YgiN
MTRMTSRKLALLGAVSLFAVAAWPFKAHAQRQQDGVFRIAELEIDPAQIGAYKAALREEIAASIRSEPGVLRLYAVSIHGHPEQVLLFEMYASQAAYESHLQTPHFKKYKAETQAMVRSLKLTEADPILLGSK